MRISIEALIRNRIKKHGPGWCFAIMHFLDLGNEISVRKALSQLEKQNVIRRVTQGIYDYPKVHSHLGTIPPDLDVVAKVIAEKNGVHIQPAGAHAAHLVGLTTQVPNRVIFLTEGPARQVRIGGQVMIFKRSSRKTMLPAGTRVGLLIQAIRNLGKDHINTTARRQIARFLKTCSDHEIRQHLRFAPEWIRSLITEIQVAYD